MKALSKSCGCNWELTKTPRQPTDKPIVASAEELALIKSQLHAIETMLAVIFGDAYSREPESLKTRAMAADLIERHFDGIVQRWAETILELVKMRSEPNVHPTSERLEWNANALIRFIWHLRDPDNIETYVYLRAHCQEGMLSRMGPGQFNVVHIALKQVLLEHVSHTTQDRQMLKLRDAIVAAVDERRLIVSQFYVESRERQLRASEEKYRNSINHAPNPMYEIDVKNGTIISTNSAADRLFAQELGHEPASQVGRSIVDLVPPEMRAATLKHFKNVLVNESDQVYDVPLYGRYYFDITSALIPYGSDNFIQMILHDVTERREIMGELLKTERLAAAGTFAAGVAHEVNNPLASISSLVQSLVSAESDPNRRMTMHTILSQIARISTTLKDLMNFARPTSAERQRVDLNGLIAETLRLIGYNKRFAGITIESKLAPDLKPVFVEGNGVQQVLLNLLFNAADSLPDHKGVIQIVTANKTSANGDRSGKVLIRVIDNGIGIPREHLERVFDPFFTTKPAGSGVGLGLSLCQRIILDNDGAIRIESEVGKGTTVTIALHAFREDETASANAAQ